MTRIGSRSYFAVLTPLLGSPLREVILLYILTHGDAYPRELAQVLGFGLLAVQKQLATLEEGGVVASRLRGRVRLYQMNPRYPFRRELENLLRRAIEFIPTRERERLYVPRLRPRKAGKPL
jgi:predicted ArsR family transcriptional regulator